MKAIPQQHDNSGKTALGFASVEAAFEVLVKSIYNNLKQEKKEQKHVDHSNKSDDDEFFCPISLSKISNAQFLFICSCAELLRDPVFIKNCGHTFDREAIEEWVKQIDRCPLCKIPFSQKDLLPNNNLKSLVEKITQ